MKSSIFFLLDFAYHGIIFEASDPEINKYTGFYTFNVRGDCVANNCYIAYIANDSNTSASAVDWKAWDLCFHLSQDQLVHKYLYAMQNLIKEIIKEYIHQEI